MPNKPRTHKPTRPPLRRVSTPEDRRDRDRLYGRRWHKRSRAFLQEHPLCVQCKARGEVAAASVVDHVIPHKGNVDRFWDWDNLQALCVRCHNAKSARERGQWERSE